MRRRLAYSVIDQDERTTSSLGIYHYSRNLLHHLAGAPDPGFDVVVLASAANVEAFTPDPLPPWLRVRVVPGRHATGWRRLWSDHVAGPRALRACGADAVFYPKGFLPWRLPRGIRAAANIHDTIVFHYARHHPGFFPRGKLAYFQHLTRLALRRAAWITTDSEHSRRELEEIEPAARGRVQSVYFGAGIQPRGEVLPLSHRDGLLVLGSRLPHKATRETLRLLDQTAAAEGRRRAVTVTGLDGWPAEWGPAPVHLEIRFRGRLAPDALAEAFRRARALVLLSTIEGFGLPLVEAYAAGTPVCYRDASSLGELMRGAPGGWDGRDANGFAQSLRATEALNPAQIAGLARDLAERTAWSSTVRIMTGLFQQLLDAGSRPDA